VIRPTDRLHRLEGDALVGLIASSEQLTVAGARLVPGGSSGPVRRDGDTLVFVEDGTARVHAESSGEAFEFELSRWDAAYVPRGASYWIEGTGTRPVDILIGVAPDYRPLARELGAE